MSTDSSPPGTLRLCLLYADEDQKLSANLEKALRSLARQKKFELWSARDIVAGDEYSQVRAQHIAAANLLVCLISLDFPSYYERLPPESILARYQLGEVRLIPVLLRMTDKETLDPPFPQLTFVPANNKAMKDWKDRDRAVHEVVRVIKEQMRDLIARFTGGLSLQDEQALTTAPEIPWWHVPYARNLHFTGREALLAELHAHFQRSQASSSSVQVLSGPGGVGKTQIAVEYAYRYGKGYRAALWSRADTPENLAFDGLRLAQVLGLPVKNEAEQDQVLSALKRWFANQPGWLLIMDNAQDFHAALAFLPAQHQGHVLLTTRSEVAQALEVTSLAYEEGMLLLLRSARILVPGANIASIDPGVQEKAREIARMLNGSPLACAQAGAYLEETGSSLEEFIQHYQTQRSGHAMPVDGSGARIDFVEATFALASEQVRQISLPVVELLKPCAVFHAAEIPIALLGAATSDQFLLPGEADLVELEAALRIFDELSIIHLNLAQRTLSMDHLVQETLRQAMSEQERHLWAARVIEALNKAWPEPTVANWERSQEYLPHAYACADLLAQWPGYFAAGVHLLINVGRYLSLRAFYIEAERLLLQAQALCEKEPEQGELALAAIFHELGWIAHWRRNDAEADRYYQRALAIRESKLGKDNLLTAQTVQRMGQLRVDCREDQAAELLLEQALATRIRHLGANHPEVAETLNSLAMLARHMENHALAETLYRRVQAIYELAGDQQGVATSLFNQATLFFTQRAYDQAEPLYRRALEIREQVPGAEHPGTATTLNGLATNLRLQGKAVEGEPLARRALSIYRQTWGNDHPDTARALLTLGLIMYRLENYAEAEINCVEALAILDRLPNPAGPVLVTATRTLATIYHKQKRYTLAGPLYQRASDLSREVYGPEHAFTRSIQEQRETNQREMNQ